MAPGTKPDRKVALKILPKEFAEDKDRISRFDKESQPKLCSKSGKIYFQNNFNLFAADAESGEVAQITDFPSSGTSTKIINISSGESQIAFVTFEDASWKIMVKPVNSPQTREIINLKMPITNLIWHPDGRSLLFSQLTEEFYRLYSIGLDGGAPVQPFVDARRFQPP